MVKNLAPIVLFVYDRLEHTKQTVEALKKNQLASESILFIYSDAEKDESNTRNVNQVREYIKTINGFKKVIIKKREVNWGLADSIIDGVTKIVKEYDKIIVLEDDMVTSPYFLKFMNEALSFYEHEKKVWHITGWNYPINTDGLSDVFLWRFMICWGWATWSDRWKYFEKDVDKTIRDFSKKEIEYLNLDNHDNAWLQVLANKKQKINTWAIFWYATICKQQGLCLNPSRPLILNIGFDGTGQHCNEESHFSTKPANTNKFIFTKDIQENTFVVDKIKKFQLSSRKSFLVRVINKIKRMTNNTIKSLL